MNRRYFLLSFFSIIFTFVILSCNDGVIYEDEKNIDSSGWGYNKALVFSLPIEKAPVNYNLELEIRHKEDFPNQNVYVKIATTVPNDTIITKVVSLELTDHPAVWAGKCSGGSCELDILLQDHAYFKKNGIYKVEIYQYTRDSLLKGIESIGLKLLEIKK